MTLRDYQADITGQVQACNGHPLVQLDTGAGKTPIIATMCGHYSHNIVVTHRNELAVQASEKLAALRLEHDTITTDATRRRAALRHVRAGHGRHIQRGHGQRLVASVQSLLAAHERGDLQLDIAAPWRIWIDEAHHATPENMWGRLVSLFPNASVGGFTGTPAMLDGRPLHVSKGGLFTNLIQAKTLVGDSTRTLIRQGYLADYVAYSPQHRVKSTRMQAEVAGSTLDAYRRIAPGTRAIVLCTSISHAQAMAEQFRAARVPAWHITSDQTATDVARKIDDFAQGRCRVMCAVDMVSEGFDCPEAETLICTNYTASFVRWRQWVGRVLRPGEGKVARIIDQAGNILEHGMPDDPVLWDILSPPAKTRDLRHRPCGACDRMYLVSAPACPACGEPNDLLETRGQTQLPRHVVERLDMALVERERQLIASKALQEVLHERIVWPYFSDSGVLGRAVASVRRWYVAELERQHVPCAEINAFLRSRQAQETTWWTNRFTVRDVASPTATQKPLKEHTKWLKSR